MKIIEGVRISKIFPETGYEALHDISLYLDKGESVGIVGESGSGKSTLSWILGDLMEPTSGSVFFYGKDIRGMTGDEKKAFRTAVQYIFQDPKGAMNPFFSLRNVLEEPLKINRKDLSADERREMVESMTRSVGLDVDILSKHRDEISGGQAQRIVIARSLLLNPDVIIADECVSALDLSVQAQIINLLRRIREKRNTSFIFISHDIDLVRYFCDRVYVMLHGRIVEVLDAERIEEEAKSDYGAGLSVFLGK